MDFDEGKIFFKDVNKKVFVFDEQGKFLNTVGAIGPGPDEHYSIFDFYLDKKNKQVCIIDVLKSVIFLYTYEGKIVEKKKVREPYLSNFSKAYLVKDNTLLLIKSNSPISKYNFSVLGGKNYETVNYFVPYLFIGERSQSEGGLTVATTKNETFITALISDTIYKYDVATNSIHPDIVFIGKCRPMTIDDVKGKELEIALDALITAREKNLSYGIDKIAITQKFLHFHVQTRDEFKRVFWNLETNQGNISDVIDTSYINNFFTYMKVATDDAFVCAIPAYIYVEVDWSENESARIAAENTDEDDNPIIAFYYFD
jgi:hypothetical protein